jgi:hypothetical protein
MPFDTNPTWMQPQEDGDGARRLVWESDTAKVYERRIRGRTVYEVIRPEVCHFATIAAAEAAAGAVGSHVFLGAGDVALVARGGLDGLAYEVHQAQTGDQLSFDSPNLLPGDVLVYEECCNRFDDALEHFLAGVLSR